MSRTLWIGLIGAAAMATTARAGLPPSKDVGPTVRVGEVVDALVEFPSGRRSGSESKLEAPASESPYPDGRWNHPLAGASSLDSGGSEAPFAYNRDRVTVVLFSKEPAMIDLIKKTLLTGVGLAVMTKDKVEELGRDLVAQAKLSEGEGREFIDSLVTQSETARSEFENRVSALVKKSIESLNLVHKDEVAKLQAQIDDLAAELKKHDGSATHG